MRHLRLLLVVTGLRAVASAAAPAFTHECQLLRRPDRTPVVGAKVLFRQFRADGHLESEVELTSDAHGAVRAELNPTVAASRFEALGYFLVDVPGCALAVSQVRHSDRTTLDLKAAGDTTGQVVGPDGDPVRGAVVTCVSLAESQSRPHGAWLNAPELGVRTPALTATTDADGRFRLRCARVYSWGGSPALGLLTARAETGGRVLLGSHPDYWLLDANERQPEWMQVADRTLKVGLAGRLRGRVLDRLTQAPLAGAKLTLVGDAGYLLTSLPAATSGADGRFAFDEVPPSPRCWCQADLAGYGRLTYAVRAAVDAQPTEWPFLLRPHARLTGRVVDALTGAPLATQAKVYACYEEGTPYGPGYIGHASSVTTCQPDGTYVLDTPIGPQGFSVFARGYANVYNRRLEVTPTGLTGIDARLARTPCFLVRLTRPDGTGLTHYSVQLRQANGEVISAGGFNEDPVWFWSVKRWGLKCEVRVTLDRDEVLPWTEITANPEHWPLELKVR